MRLHLYISHSFDHADKYERILEFARSEAQIADFSVPVWRQVPGDDIVVRTAISERIARSNRVLVLLTDEIHRSPHIEFEVQIARELGKPIIGIYPYGENEAPIPRFLDGAYYRMVGWRRGALTKALLCEYPPDRRVFDIAELEERKELISKIAGAAGIASFLVAGATAANFARLKKELEHKGLKQIGAKGPTFLETTVVPTLGGAATGALVMAIFVGTKKAIASGAALGGAVGLGIGVTRYYSLRIQMLGALAKLEVESFVGGP